MDGITAKERQMLEEIAQRSGFGTLEELPVWKKTVTDYGRFHRMYQGSPPPVQRGWVLDMGCSDGTTTEEIAAHYPGCSVVGVDMNPEMIEKARLHRSSVEYLVDNGYNSQFPDGSFDLVFCNNNLYYIAEHLKQEEGQRIGNGIGRLVAPNGFLAVAGHLSGKPTQYDRLILQKDTDRFSVYCSTDLEPRIGRALRKLWLPEG